MRCPWPVLRAARAMRIAIHVELIADDPVAVRDVPEMARARGWTCTVSHAAGEARFTLKNNC
ncbi:hypothetical protein BH10PSE13_BH10PSE13_26430 [soil metagenome]